MDPTHQKRNLNPTHQKRNLNLWKLLEGIEKSGLSAKGLKILLGLQPQELEMARKELENLEKVSSELYG